ncbi:hypothetical protein JCM10212_002092 [Sporobolomyces blumeae]
MLARPLRPPATLVRSAVTPAFPSPSRRVVGPSGTTSLSLWTEASRPPSVEPPASSSKPSLSDFLPPPELPAATYLEPLSTVYLSLPPLLSLSYAAFIPLFTLLYRSSTTLPVVWWQRRRTRRYAQVVVPEIKVEQRKIALETRDECRRAGKSFEEYQEVFATRAKTAARRIARKHKCSPRLTLILPPLFHIPIFVTMTLTLRDACTRALSSLPLDSSTLATLTSGAAAAQPPVDPATSTAVAESFSILSETALQHLHELSSTSFLWCPSLVLPDPTMFLPLGVGLAALLNVEVQAKNRQAQTAAAEGTVPLDSAEARPESSPLSTGSTTAPISASERRRILARRARQGQVVQTRQISSSLAARSAPSPPSRLSASPPASSPPAAAATTSPRSAQSQVVAAVSKPNTARIVTNVLRFASVAFIPVAGLAPSAVCLYWIASNLFTLVQNLSFAFVDRARENERRTRMILESGSRS